MRPLTDKERFALRKIYQELAWPVGAVASPGKPYLLPLDSADIRALPKLIHAEEGSRL